jgi:hypothetical protein
MYRWYRIKITVRWEDNENTYPGTPSRVVQYEGTSCFLQFFTLLYYNYLAMLLLMIMAEKLAYLSHHQL